MSNYHIVLGAGPLARATATALLRRNLDVRLISRSGHMIAPPSGLEIAAVDILDVPALTRACLGARSIYLCAQPAYHRWVTQFVPLQSAALSAAEASGARFIVAENLYGYGMVSGPMTEDLPLRPNTRKGRVRADMHRQVMVAHETGLVRAAVARGADFYGPWVEGSAVGLRAMAAVLDGRTVEVMGKPDTLHSYTYVGDFGEALAILGTEDRALGRVWHVPNAAPVSTRRFFEIAARLAGKTARLRTMSRLELSVLGLFIPPLKESIEMLYEFEVPFVVDHSRFVSVFGDLSTSLEAALTQTLDWVESGQRRPQQAAHV